MLVRRSSTLISVDWSRFNPSQYTAIVSAWPVVECCPERRLWPRMLPVTYRTSQMLTQVPYCINLDFARRRPKMYFVVYQSGLFTGASSIPEIFRLKMHHLLPSVVKVLKRCNLSGSNEGSLQRVNSSLGSCCVPWPGDNRRLETSTDLFFFIRTCYHSL